MSVLDNIANYFIRRGDGGPEPQCYLLEGLERTQIRVTHSEYEGRTYCNIREWVHNSKPCKQGVTFGETGFLHLRHCLGENHEYKMIKEAYEEYVRELIDARVKKDCVGCVNEHPSQRSHTCFDQEGVINKLQFERLEHLINSWGFTGKLAEIARLKGLPLRNRPHEAFKLAHYTLREEILKKMTDESDAHQDTMVV